MAANFFEIVKFSEIVMLRQEIFGLSLLIKIKVLNFIEKSLDLASPALQVSQRPLCDSCVTRFE